MRIAFLIRALCRGGAERQLVNLAVALRQAGHEVSVHVFYPGGEFEPELRAGGVPLRIIGKSGPWDSFGFLRRTLGSLRAEQPEIVHSYMGGANIAAAMLKPWLRPAKIVWGVRAAFQDLRDYGWLSTVSLGLERLYSRRADLLISNSRAGGEFVRKHFKCRRVEVVPNGIDLREFYRDSAEQVEMRAAWGIAEEEIVIGRVGRIDPMKDYPTFLRTAANLAEEDRRYRFVCVGSGSKDCETRLRQLAEELKISNRVIWAGMQTEMRRVYNGLDLLVSSSCHGEGFPNVLIEAMACGVHCVSTDIGDSRNIIGDDRWVVAAGDAPALAAACRSALRESRPPTEMRTRVEGSYSVAALASRTVALLEELLNESSSRPRSS